MRARVVPLRARAPQRKPVKSYGPDHSGMSWHAVFRPGRENLCPGCARSNWAVGRITAECGFCKTVLPIAGDGVDL